SAKRTLRRRPTGNGDERRKIAGAAGMAGSKKVRHEPRGASSRNPNESLQGWGTMNWSQYASLKDIVRFFVAIDALSTLNFLQARRKDRRSIRVSISSTLPTYGPDVGAPYMCVTAANDGHRTVTVATLALELPDRSRLFMLIPGGLPRISRYYAACPA